MSLSITIATYHSLPEAEAARLLLAHEGIEAILLDETTVAMDWLLMNAIGGIKLQVGMDDAERAKNIISAFEIDRKQRLQAEATKFVRFQCSECGAPQEFTGDRRGGVEECTRCRSYIDVPELTDEQLLERHMTLDQPAAAEPTDNVHQRIPVQVEVVCVLAFAYLPLLFNAIPFWDWNQSKQVGLVSEMSHLIMRMFSVIPPLLFFITVSNEPWSKFGIARPKWITDFLLAVGVWMAANCAVSMSFIILPASDATGVTMDANGAGVSEHSLESLGWGGLAICLVGLIANSITEELTMRGYLVTRFEQMFKSPVVAVGLSSAIFASYHIYQGFPSAVAIFALALVYGAFFCIFRRLWPLVIAHTFYNLTIYLNL